MTRYQVVTDGLTTVCKYSRRYAVIDTKQNDRPVFQTDHASRALDLAYELNLKEVK